MKYEDEKQKPKLTRFADLDGDGDGDGSKQKPRVSLLESILRRKQLLGVERQLLQNARSIGLAQSKNQASRVNQLNNQKIQLQFAKSTAEAEFEYLDALEQAANEENEQTKQQLLQEAGARNEIKTALLLIQYQQALADEAQRRALAEEQVTKNIQQQEFDLRDRLGLVSPQEKIENFKQGLIDKLGEGDARIPGQVDLQRQLLDPTTFEKIQQSVRGLGKELQELTNPANMIISSANQIGTAFTDSFKSVIDGSATTQEALASFFKNIGNFFLDMAMQIIQKMITMYILNTVVGLLPGGGGGGKGVLGQGTLDSVSSYSGITGSTRFAKGAAFAKNKIIPYAKGGIVNKPTMFAYADGGAGRFGLMGEQGAEAILPLRRGPGGKLGVESSGGGVKVGTININVENTGENLSPAAQKQIANQVRGIVIGTLADERRSGGML
jgi:phage-related minor tail protein